MPDVEPGSTPVLFGDLKAAYLMVVRRATTMRPNPYAAPFCTTYTFEARIGGAPICTNAVRLLRIR